MSSEDREEKNALKWDRKKKFILVNFNGAIGSRERAIDEISKSQRSLDRVTDLLTSEISRLRQMERVYENDSVYLRFNPVTEGSIDILASLSVSDASNATALASAASKIRTNTDSLLGAAIVSGATVSSMATTTVQLAGHMQNKEAIISYVEAINEPTARQRRIELSLKLSAINSRLTIKLDGAWQTLQDRSKEDRFLQAASSARELISDLLHTLAPDDQVKDTKWFKPENGAPTQRQRSRFVMLGRNSTLGEGEFQAIYDLAVNIRDSYQKLNRIAHLRNYEEDLQGLTETLIDHCQIYLLKLLELRSIYYES